MYGACAVTICVEHPPQRNVTARPRGWVSLDHGADQGGYGLALVGTNNGTYSGWGLRLNRPSFLCGGFRDLRSRPAAVSLFFTLSIRTTICGATRKVLCNTLRLFL